MKRKNATRSALVTSILALLVCVSMLVGATFAWFTDSVASGTNVIAAGNLDVELEYAKVVNGQITDWTTVQGADKVFDPNALWEPGRVEVAYLKVSNLGTLNLKYQLGVNVASEVPGTNVEGDPFLLSDNLVFKAVEMNDAMATYSDREAVAAAAGTEKGLKDYNSTATALEPNGVDYVALIVYMPTTVGNEANYKTGTDRPEINLGVNLFATQVEAEEDSFGNDYDKNVLATVNNVADLRAAINNANEAGTIYLEPGIYNIDSQITIPGKSLNIVGLGDNVIIHMTDTRVNYNKIFYIYGSAEGEDVTVDISNVTLTADIPTKSDVWVRTDTQTGATVSGDVTVNLDNVTCASVICDNNYVDGDTVNLNINDSTVGKVDLQASPFNGNGLNTYTNLTHKNSRVDSITISSSVQDLTHITINGAYPTEAGEQSTVKWVDTLEELQAALDTAADGETVILAADITGHVTVTQKPDVKITIDGNGKSYTGTITVNGKSARYPTAGLTIKNVNFVGGATTDAYVALGGNDSIRYTNNVTVQDCTFSGTGEEDVAIKSYTGGDKNLTITGCVVNAGMHSLVQVTNVEEGLKITNCKVYSKNGANLNSTPSLEMSGCTFDVQGYAVRFGVGSSTVNGAFEINNSTLKSACAETGDAVIIFRGTMTGSTLSLNNTTLVGTPKITGNAKVTIDGAPYVSTTDELQAAINAGESKILLGEGEFTADLYVVPANRNLTITGQGAATKLNFKNQQVRLELFDSLTISNCTMGRMVNKSWGQLVFGSSTTAGGVYTISNCIFNGEGTQGIYINQDVAATFNIEDCTFNGDFGGEGAITVQNNDGVNVTVNVNGCAFNDIPATSHEICVLYAYEGWTLNAAGVPVYWKAK